MNVFYWLYLWQIKEYRLDRMLAYLRSLDLEDLVKLWLWGKLRRPQFTIKIFLITLLFLILLLLSLLAFYWLNISWLYSIIILILSAPLMVSLAVGIISIPSLLITRILRYLAAFKRHRFTDLVVIGVTGSYGKTTTKEAIAGILSAKFKVLKTKGGVNTKIGIAKQILSQLTSDIKVYVVEMGAYKKGEITELVQLVEPKIGVLTGINEQHLALFGSLQNIIDAKFELIEGLPEDGVAIINTADQNVVSEKDRIKVKTLEYQSSTPTENINAAIKIAQKLGLNHEETEKGQQNIIPTAKRMQEKKGIKRSVIIDDTYSSNPYGFKYALNFLKEYRAKKKILITTGIYELGSEAETINKKMHDLAKDICDEIITTDKMNAKFYPSAQLIENPDTLFNLIKEISDKNTIFLFEGRNRVINQVLVRLSTW